MPDYSGISWLYVFALITSEMTSYISIENQTRHSLWPSLASYVPERMIYFLPLRLFNRMASCYVLFHIIETLPAFLLRHSLPQSLLHCAALTSSLTLRVLEIISFVLWDSICHYPALSFRTLYRLRRYHLQSIWNWFFFPVPLSGNFPACLLGISHTGYP
jgi:hypothetical protein